MHNKPLHIIVALDEDGGFGKDGKIPWYFPEDLKHFKEVTTGHVCIMGRKTYEDMLEMRKERDAKKGVDKPIGEILPNRTSFVITRNEDMETPGATKAKSISEALQQIPEKDPRTVFVIGGERMFIEALSSTTTVHITLIPGRYFCDKKFPVNTLSKKFKIIDGTVEGELKFITYQRIK